MLQFQSTHPVWGATPGNLVGWHRWEISIHAPRVGCDPGHPVFPWWADISIHAPRVGCDSATYGVYLSCNVFQSTHPVWGATLTPTVAPWARPYFNPRTPCGVRRSQHFLPSRSSRISIHAPRVGCDAGQGCRPCPQRDFNPRTPCGVRHSRSPSQRRSSDFNPRTPCGVRLHQARGIHHRGDFNPRTPCGVRPPAHHLKGDHTIFQSTHPVWGATSWVRGRPQYGQFQSTHPVWGATAQGPGFRPLYPDFNPRTPCGVRRGPSRQTLGLGLISIHAPRVGCDKHQGHGLAEKSFISIHAPRVGCDLYAH